MEHVEEVHELEADEQWFSSAVERMPCDQEVAVRIPQGAVFVSLLFLSLSLRSFEEEQKLLIFL